MARSLEGKTALITGGAVRIGGAITEALADAGVNVVIHCNNSRDDAESLADACIAKGVDAWVCAANLSNSAEVSALYEDAQSKAGSVDILVNNASIFPTDTFETMTRDAIEENLQVNAFAPLALSRKFAANCNDGDILNLLDTRMVDHDPEHASYHISKRLLHTFTKLMAIELAPGIRLNAIAPGLVLPPPGKDMDYLEGLTHTNPMQRHGDSAAVADAAIFLLRSEFITGQIIFVDGGRNLLGGLYD